MTRTDIALTTLLPDDHVGKNLEGVKPGDNIDITYTQALLTSIERAK